MAAQAEAVQAQVGERPDHHVLPYCDRMDLAYAAADLAVCRAGAMTCAELAAVGLPAVYVPLPIGNGEQALNARPVVDAGGGLLVADAELDAAYVTGTVLPLLGDAGRLTAMAAAAGRLGHRDATSRLPPAAGGSPATATPTPATPTGCSPSTRSRRSRPVAGWTSSG